MRKPIWYSSPTRPAAISSRIARYQGWNRKFSWTTTSLPLSRISRTAFCASASEPQNGFWQTIARAFVSRACRISPRWAGGGAAMSMMSGRAAANRAAASASIRAGWPGAAFSASRRAALPVSRSASPANATSGLRSQPSTWNPAK